jgi:signal transduction histidine kinase
VSYAIVRNHEGLIHVESREGHFAAFHVLLPAVLDEKG